MILTREAKRVFIRFKQVSFSTTVVSFSVHITLCATSSFYVILWSYVQFSAGVLEKTFHAMILNRKKDYCDVLHMLKLLMHFSQYIVLFFKPSGVNCYRLRALCHAPREK